MRRDARYIVGLFLVCLLLAYQSVCAATRLTPERHHNFGFWGNIGYYGLLNNAKQTKTIPGISPALGLGYRFFNNNFILQVGAEGQFSRSSFSMPLMRMRQRMLDADFNQEPFIMTATLSNFREQYTHVALNVPFYLGYEKNSLYLLAGFAASVSMYGRASSRCVLDTKAEYERFIGEFQQIPNHGMATVTVESGEKDYKMNFNVLLHAEIGGRLDQFAKYSGFNDNKHSHRIYLGAYADYGVLNAHADIANGSQLTMDYTQGVKASLVPLLLSDQMQGKTVHPLTIGAKLSVFFELPELGKSYQYDNKHNHIDRKRGGNQVITN